ncbi:hypothetical protein [Thiohalorhabdus sp.]|uniref:hypothetical protein n=1 Tax=Thiohalorhabdus sp. TaxID=3094134 RepID=UPI002FC392CF
MTRRNLLSELPKAAAGLLLNATVAQADPGEPCSVCRGTGRDLDDPNLNCSECGGTGWVPGQGAAGVG